MKSLLKITLLAFTLCVINLFTANAQNNGTVRGFVYDKATGEPVLFTNVYLKGTTLGAATDVNGYYSITKIPAGNYVIEIDW